MWRSYLPGISDPRVAVSGRVLPAVRSISTFQHRDLGFHDHAVTIFLPAWGQLIDHDMASGAETKGEFIPLRHSTWGRITNRRIVWAF